jgi:predicted CXXCH cytochrome family protein
MRAPSRHAMTRGEPRSVGLVLTLALALLLLAAAAPAPAAAALSPAAEECGQCHNAGNTGTVDVDGVTKSLAVDLDAYAASLHGQLDCTACHLGFKKGPHTAGQTEGWLQTAKLEACRNCHADQFSMYEGSFHGELAMGEDASGAPLCADCHTPHEIVAPDSVAFRTSTIDLCTRCHGEKSETYLDSYHGKAFLLGKEEAATCTDCHGGHKILPASDPESTISDENRVATCAACHPGANENFAEYMVHIDPKDPTDSFTVWLFWLAYVLLIAVVFTFGGVHTALYIYRGIKDGLYGRKHH